MTPSSVTQERNHPSGKRKLDAVVKIGLGVFVGSFLLIWGGMFLTRPDRSIPPFSIGAQQGTVVAVHVPSWTSDAGIEALIERLRTVRQQGRTFGRMKIHPTTPEDPNGRYQRMTVYIFTFDAWAEPDILRRYLAGGPSAADHELREGFEKAIRGYYRLDENEEEGRIGPLRTPSGSPATAAYSRVLFHERFTNGASATEGSASAAGSVRTLGLEGQAGVASGGKGAPSSN